MNDKAKVLKVATLLLQKSPLTLLESSYGRKIVDELAVPAAEKALGEDLTTDEMEDIKATCGASLGPLGRILGPSLEDALNRSASVLEHGVPSVKTLIDYLESAMRLDIANARWITD